MGLIIERNALGKIVIETGRGRADGRKSCADSPASAGSPAP
jgi:hypothetical protein